MTLTIEEVIERLRRWEVFPEEMNEGWCCNIGGIGGYDSATTIIIATIGDHVNEGWVKNRFNDDEEALAHVQRQAELGSVVHQAALAIATAARLGVPYTRIRIGVTGNDL